MDGIRLADELITDLLRSAWIVEAARARVFSQWSKEEQRFSAPGSWALGRADLLEAALRRRDTRVDESLVGDHASWMTHCVPDPHEPFADLFLARLGGWVDAHAVPYVDEGAEAMADLGERERLSVTFPAEFPAPSVPALLDSPPPGPRSADVRLRVGVLGDLHAGSIEGEALARAAIADLNLAGPDVVVQLGDLTQGGEEEEFRAATRLLAELDAPVEATIGNHDAYSVSEGRLSGRERFARWVGREPDGRLVERAGVRLALLDSVEYGISPFPPYDLVTGTFAEGRGGALVRGALTAEQHDLLAEVARPGSPPALVFLHHPPQPFTGFPPVLFGLSDADSGRLHATCDSGNVWGVFAGHTHRNHRGRGFDGVPVQEVGVPRDFPFGYGLIDVGERGYLYRFHQISDRDLVTRTSAPVAAIQRRYSAGRPQDRGFTWERPTSPQGG